MRLLTALIALILTSSAQGQLLIEVTGDFYLPTDVSSDGTVVVGNIQGPYETFYWTTETGPLPLGRATVPVTGGGAGSPNVSADGTKISATIMTDDNMYETAGIWDVNIGWQTLMPPTPPDGGVVDSAIGDAWGLSGDGVTLVGLYWRPNATDGSAHPCAGTVADGVHDLGTPGGSGRANAANYDGSVIGGWSAGTNGIWQPTVWVDGERTVLEETDVSNFVSDVNRDGTIVVGRSYTHPNAAATIWRWNGSTWDREYIGGLPGMVAFNGLAWFDGVSADGGVIVGTTRPAFSPVYWGMIWMPDTGLIDADDWVAGMGATTPYPIAQMTAVTDDGKTVVAIMQNQSSPFQYTGVVIHCVSDGDADGDGDVDLHDAAMLQLHYTGAGAGAINSSGEALDSNCDLDIDPDDVAVFVENLTGPNG